MLVISNQPHACPILKLLAQLLPELYHTRSNYCYLLVLVITIIIVIVIIIIIIVITAIIVIIVIIIIIVNHEKL